MKLTLFWYKHINVIVFQSSFLRSLFLLDAFASISGLKVNYEKTEALWIGAYKSSNLTFPLSKPITWANERVFALGVWFSTLEDKSALNSNFIEKIEKIRGILEIWSAKRLTLLGKIAIIKTLAVSQIVYIYIVISSNTSWRTQNNQLYTVWFPLGRWGR